MTKEDKKRQARSILAKYNVNCAITDQADFDFLMGIFSNHESWDIKRGCGVASIKVMKTLFGEKCYAIVRTDGSVTDISFLKSIVGEDSSTKKLKIACRNAIVQTILDFRSANLIEGVTTCPFTGEVLFKKNTHIDHYDSKFCTVANDWIASKDKSFLISKLNSGSKDLETEVYFTDQELVKDFIEYHNAHTRLRVVSKTANLTILNR